MLMRLGGTRHITMPNFFKTGLSAKHRYCNISLFTARRLAKRVYAVVVCLCVCVCVCLSHSGIVSKRLKIGSRKQRRMIAP